MNLLAASTASPSKALAFSIAGVRVRLCSDAPDLPLTATSARTVFACSNEPPMDINLLIRWLPDEMQPAHDLSRRVATLVFDSGQLWRLYRDWRGDWTFHFASDHFGKRPYKVAQLSRDFSSGVVLVDRRASYHGQVDPLEYPLDELLWIHWLATRASIELHACGVVPAGAGESGGGYVFVGQSGAGKTTTARQWARHPAFQVLSDDRIIVRRDQHGFSMHGTPWHGEGRFARPASAPLDGIFLLTQAAHTEVRRLSPAVGLSRLLAASFPVFHDHALLSATTDTVVAMVKTVPFYELRFTPDASVVTTVLDHVRRGDQAPRPGPPP
jgi:hypothetical protein